MAAAGILSLLLGSDNLLSQLNLKVSYLGIQYHRLASVYSFIVSFFDANTCQNITAEDLYIVYFSGPLTILTLSSYIVSGRP